MEKFQPNEIISLYVIEFESLQIIPNWRWNKEIFNMQLFLNTNM